MNLGVTATQVGLTSAQRDKFREILTILKPSEIHHGDCVGGDDQLHDIAVLDYRIEPVIHPPIIEKKRAFKKAEKILEAKDYISRNHDIVDDTDFLVGFPKGMEEELQSGTWSTIRYARKISSPHIIVYPDGSYANFGIEIE